MVFLEVVFLATALFLCWSIHIAIHRLYFSPLAKFPGPKLAALTYWYEFYYDCVCHGRFSWDIQRMHDKHGPIVRINPKELHVRDADWHDELYTSALRPRNKEYFFVGRIGRGTIFGTVPHEHHRLRRSALNPFFSKRSILGIEPQIQEKVDKLCRRLGAYAGQNEPLNLEAAYMSLTMDVITHYAYGEPLGLLDLPDFGAMWREMIKMTLECMPFVRHFPWLMDVLDKIPYSVAPKFSESIALMLRFQLLIRERIVKTLQKGSDAAAENKTHKTIFEELRDSDLPQEEKTIDRLKEEGFVLTAAAADATSMTLTVLSYHLMDNPEVLKRVKAELCQAQPDLNLSIPSRVLEQLPLFRSIITEGLRISAISTSRLIRSAPYETLHYKGWDIPPNTPIGMTSHFIHMSSLYYENPFKFDPDRWIRADLAGTRSKIDKYFVPFTRGSRACIGINLAYAELYLTIATVFRRVDIQLFETTRDDVAIVRDAFIGNPKESSNGVRVTVGIGGDMRD